MINQIASWSAIKTRAFFAWLFRTPRDDRNATARIDMPLRVLDSPSVECASADLGDEWTLIDLLSSVGTYMRQAAYSTGMLYGHRGYLSKDAWEGFKRITVHCMRDREATLCGDYQYFDVAGFPAYGGIMFGSDEHYDDDRKSILAGISAAYFLRHEKLPWYVTCEKPGITYECVLVYIDRGKRWPMRWFSVVDTDGKVHSCKTLDERERTVTLPPPKRRGSRRCSHFTVTQRQWRTFEEISNDCATEQWEKREDGAFSQLLGYLLNAYAQRLYSSLVIVSTGQKRISFGVPIEQCPSFFKDRGITIENKKGRRTPVIHWVKAHTKQYANRTVNTRVHLRGERRFQWKGYQVSVVIPGLHRPATISCAATETDGPIVPKGMIGLASGIDRMFDVESGNNLISLASVRDQNHSHPNKSVEAA